MHTMTTGDEVKIHLNGGMFIRGEVEELTPDGATVRDVRGRLHVCPLSSLTSITAEEEQARVAREAELTRVRQLHEAVVARVRATEEDMLSLQDYVLSVGGSITIEVRSDAYEDVVAAYEEAVGRAILPHEAQSIFIVENRFIPSEWRIVFAAPSADYVYPHDVLVRRGMWRVNYKQFVTDLLEAGFALGDNTPAEVFA
jgi:hypothetical protein